jgi:hypothetical protein
MFSFICLVFTAYHPANKKAALIHHQSGFFCVAAINAKSN